MLRRHALRVARRVLVPGDESLANTARALRCHEAFHTSSARATTVLCVRKGNQVVMIGDGQARVQCEAVVSVCSSRLQPGDDGR